MNRLNTYLSNLLALSLSVGCVLIGLLWYISYEFKSAGPLEAPLVFDVSSGETQSSIANALYDEGAISGTFVFKYGNLLTKFSDSLQYGSFLLPIGSSMQDILEILTSSELGGPRYSVLAKVTAKGTTMSIRDRYAFAFLHPETIKYGIGEEPKGVLAEVLNNPQSASFRIMVIEGLTSWQIVHGLNTIDFLYGKINEIPPEGTLAPNTYNIIAYSRPIALLKRMQDSQTKYLEKEWADRSGNLPFKSLNEALVLASIVEKETGSSSERGLVASVYINRLKKGMRLQADPTVIYGITEGKDLLERKLRKSDLKMKTPYNTYVINGLPPTPISNPGLSAIHATLQPMVSDYYYFVADGKGGHNFATNYDQHLKNVAKYRASQR